jgi:hypothetical protein
MFFIRQTDGKTDTRSTQNNSSEPHKILIFVKTPKNYFLDPQTTNPNKTRRKHF